MDFVVEAAIAAIVRRDWDELKPLLHPYLHWTDRDGNTLRGRKNVLKKLADERSTEPPVFHEVRDGQIYRWTEQLRPV